MEEGCRRLLPRGRGTPSSPCPAPLAFASEKPLALSSFGMLFLSILNENLPPPPDSQASAALPASEYFSTSSGSTQPWKQPSEITAPE